MKGSSCPFAHNIEELQPSADFAEAQALSNGEVNTLEQSRAMRENMRVRLKAGGIKCGKSPIEGWKCKCGVKNKYFHKICGGRSESVIAIYGGCKTPRDEAACANWSGGNYTECRMIEKPVVNSCLVAQWIPFGVQEHHLQLFFQQFGGLQSVRLVPDDGSGGRLNRAYIRFDTIGTCQDVMKEGEDHYIMGETCIMMEPAKEGVDKGMGKRTPINATGNPLSTGGLPATPGSAFFSYGAGGLSVNRPDDPNAPKGFSDGAQKGFSDGSRRSPRRRSRSRSRSRYRRRSRSR